MSHKTVLPDFPATMAAEIKAEKVSESYNYTSFLLLFYVLQTKDNLHFSWFVLQFEFKNEIRSACKSSTRVE